MKQLIASSVVVLLLAACATADNRSTVPAGARGSFAPYDGAWRLTSGRGPEGRVPLIETYPITLIMDGGTISGTAACNSYGGDVTAVGSSFKVSVGFMTEMACAAPVMRSEDVYLSTLSRVDVLAHDDDTLTLTGRDTELHFELRPPPPTASLADTIWRLESLVEGRGPDGIAMRAHPATLVIEADGALKGSTGCRRLRGEWIERGEHILVTKLTATGHCSEKGATQDAHVVGVLGDGFTANVASRELRIFGARGDRGLIYRAR